MKDNSVRLTLLASCFLFLCGSVSAAYGIVFYPSEDAMVRFDFPNTNYGTDAALFYSALGPGYARSYLKFIVNISRTYTLKCRHVGGASAAPTLYYLPVNSKEFHENTTTWHNQPCNSTETASGHTLEGMKYALNGCPALEPLGDMGALGNCAADCNYTKTLFLSPTSLGCVEVNISGRISLLSQYVLDTNDVSSGNSVQSREGTYPCTLEIAGCSIPSDCAGPVNGEFCNQKENYCDLNNVLIFNVTQQWVYGANCNLVWYRNTSVINGTGLRSYLYHQGENDTGWVSASYEPYPMQTQPYGAFLDCGVSNTTAYDYYVEVRDNSTFNYQLGQSNVYYYGRLVNNSIAGHVYYVNGSVVAGAYVGVWGTATRNAVSDVNGFYNITLLQHGDYYIAAFKNSLWSQTGRIHLNEHSIVDLTLISDHANAGNVLFNVSVMYSNGSAAAGVNVQRIYCDGFDTYGAQYACYADSYCRGFCSTVDAGYTSSAGYITFDYRLPHYPAELYSVLRASNAGLEDWIIADLETNQGSIFNALLMITIPQQTVVTVHADGSTGLNLAGVLVRITPNVGSMQQKFTVAGGNATFTFSNILSYITVNASLDGFSPYSMYWPISGNPAPYIPIVLTNRSGNTFSVQGYLYDNLNNTMLYTDVQLKCRQGSYQPYYEPADYNTGMLGYFEWYNIPLSTQCLIHAIPPSSSWSDDAYGWVPVENITYPVTTFNFAGLRYAGSNLTAGTFILTGSVYDFYTSDPVTSGVFEYYINSSNPYAGSISGGRVEIINIPDGAFLTIVFKVDCYRERNYTYRFVGLNYTNERFNLFRDLTCVTTSHATSSTAPTTPPTTHVTTSAASTTTLPAGGPTSTLISDENQAGLWASIGVCISSVLTFAGVIAAFSGIIVFLFFWKVMKALWH